MATPTHKLRASLLSAFFVCRSTIAVSLSGSPTPATPDSLSAILLTHVAGNQADETGITIDTKSTKGSYLGRYRVGSYVQGDDDLCRWFCIDLDGGSEHKRPLLDPLIAALSVTTKAHQLGLPVYLEKSGGAKGWHVWGFFSHPQSVETARVLGLGLCPLDAKLDPSGLADPMLGVGIEVFPKAFHARETGNMVWLPWWGAAKPGGSLFYDIDSLQPLDLSEFEKISPDKLAEVLSKLPKVEQWKAPKQKEKKDKRTGAEVMPIEVEESSEAFKQWREKALSLIDISEIYSPHLVDAPEGDKDWYKCRNPFTPPDTTPSAGVSSGRSSERGGFHEFHSDTTISLFDFLIKVGKVASLPAAFRYVARLSGVPLPERAKKLDPLAASSDARPQCIVTGQQLDDLVDTSWQVFSTSQKAAPSIFLRGGQLCHIKNIDPEQLPVIEALSIASLTHHLSRMQRWYKVAGDELQATYPPKEIASDMLACPSYDLTPLLDTICSTPLVNASGQLCAQPGYNYSTRSFYVPRGLTIPEISAAPSEDEVEGAKALLSDELLGDFRFASESDKTHAVGALIQPFVMPLIKGPSPLNSIEAPTEGSGKGLLLSIISAVAMGLELEIGALPEDETEVRQRLFSELATGKPIVAFDNANSLIRKTIDSAALEGVLTATYWSERPFHTQIMRGVKNRACWFMTGVNLLYSKGIKRRRVRIRIDPKVENPWQRDDSFFKHAQPQWSYLNRPALVAAVLTLVNHWLALDKPKASKVLGRFEAWSHVVGGILEAAGFAAWLGYLSDVSERVTEEGLSDWHELVSRWNAQNKGKSLTAAELNKLAEGDPFAKEEPLLVNHRRGENPRNQSITFSKELLRRRDQVFSGYCLTIEDNAHKGQKVYALKPLKEPQQVPEAPPEAQGATRGNSAPTEGGDLEHLPF